MKTRKIKRSRPMLETLEGRTLLSTFWVNTVADTVAVNPSDGTGLDANGNISLRSAIMAANDSPGSSVIDFNIPGPGVHTIRLRSALPALTEPMTTRARLQSRPSLVCRPTVKSHGWAAASALFSLHSKASRHPTLHL